MIKRPDLPTVASALGIIATISVLGWWSIVGWVTPQQHDADFHSTQNAVIEFQSRWICDETSEELADILALPDLTPLDGERIRKLRLRFNSNECERFDD